MKVAKIINDYGVMLDDEEFEKRKIEYNSDTLYIECFLDDGIICLVPIDRWDTLVEAEGIIHG